MMRDAANPPGANPLPAGEAGKKTAPRRHLALAFGIALLVFLLDQLSKSWILGHFAGASERRLGVAPFFDLVLVWNRGVSFGLFNNDAGMNALIFSLLAAVIVAGLLVWLWRAAGGLIAVAIGLVIGGAIGNVVDRLRLGAVVDFLDFHLGAWHWPAFNIADSAICVGVALMLIDSLLVRREAAN